MLRDRLIALVEAMHEADRMVAAEAPDGVHDLRVALRRTRSLFVTFGPLLAHPEKEGLRWELRWAGRQLGDLRDVEVVYRRLDSMVQDQRVELVLGGVLTRIQDEARGAHSEVAPKVEAMRQGERYRRLMADLDRLVAELPDDDPDPDVARRRLRKDWRRLRRRIKRVEEMPGGSTARETALHDARKAAKRARYAAETLTPMFGPLAERMADAAKDVQQSLGDHRDTLLTTPVIRRLGVQAHLDGDNGFTFGRMHAEEQARGESALDAYARAVHGVQRRKLRRWLS